jgi:hypothetical protein
LSDLQLASYARQARFRGDSLVTIVAVALGESGGDPDNDGDENLVNATYGPSKGVAQIRSLWADRGTGRPRDADRLDDPLFNLQAAYAISSGGTNFRPWTVFTSGAYRTYLARAWRAVAGDGTAKVGTGLEGAGGVQALNAVDLPGIGDLAGGIVEPLGKGLARIALVGVFLTGAVGLVVAGGWQAVGSRLKPTGIG